MDTAFITLANGTYEVSRVFSGKQTAANLIQDRLIAEMTKSNNLTGKGQLRYNTSMDGSHLAKEVL